MRIGVAWTIIGFGCIGSACAQFIPSKAASGPFQIPVRSAAVAASSPAGTGRNLVIPWRSAPAPSLMASGPFQTPSTAGYPNTAASSVARSIGASTGPGSVAASSPIGRTAQ